MPAYAPTDKEREIVETAAGFGLPHDWTRAAEMMRRRRGADLVVKARVGVRRLGHQMLDEHGKPTSPVINYTGRPAKDEDQ
jgi:hypothetical protein